MIKDKDLIKWIVEQNVKGINSSITKQIYDSLFYNDNLHILVKFNLTFSIYFNEFYLNKLFNDKSIRFRQLIISNIIKKQEFYHYETTK